MSKKEKKENVISEIQPKRKRGRPRKLPIINQPEKPKLTLEQKQEAKLKIQKQRQSAKKDKEPINKERFYCTNRELTAELIKWRDSAKKVEDRIFSEELGRMIIAIGEKMLNRSEFRNYPKELKEDMLGMFTLKIIKGLKNYNFSFNNPFAFFSTAAWNSYLTVISKHYKQQNIKKDLLIKLVHELETYPGIDPNSGLSKCIKNYIESDHNINKNE